MSVTKDFGRGVYILAGKIYGPGEVTFPDTVPEALEGFASGETEAEGAWWEDVFPDDTPSPDPGYPPASSFPPPRP